jgi:phospholipid/cholesterol/gamma-HCH transport system substrate-binding protein
MRSNDALKVGLAALAAFALLIYATFALRGSFGSLGSYTQKVTFKDAKGVQEGAAVRARGVDIGEVEDVALGTRGEAVMTLRVSNEYQIRPDDLISIAGGTLGFGQPLIEITPGGRKVAVQPGPDGELPGVSGPSTETIVSRSEELLDNLNGLVSRMNRVTEGLAVTMEDPRLRGSLSRTITNFEKVTASGVIIARNMIGTTEDAGRLMRGFQGTAGQLDRTLRRADSLLGSFGGTAAQSEQLMRDTRTMVRETRGVVQSTGQLMTNANEVVKSSGQLVGDLRGTVVDNRAQLKELVENLNSAMKRLDTTLEQAGSFLNDPDLRGDLKATAANVKEATANLKKVTEDVQGLTGDPKVQEDLKTTLTNLRDASADAAAVFRKVSGVIGAGSEKAKGIGQRVSGTQVRADVTRGLTSDRNRLDVDATVPWSDDTFFRIGLFDLGENTRFNGQLGHRLSNSFWARYGLHASKVGVGLDIGNRMRPPFSMDLYGINRTRLDVRGNLPITRSLDFTLGLDNVFRRADPVVGLRYRQ